MCAVHIQCHSETGSWVDARRTSDTKNTGRLSDIHEGTHLLPRLYTRITLRESSSGLFRYIAFAFSLFFLSNPYLSVFTGKIKNIFHCQVYHRGKEERGRFQQEMWFPWRASINRHFIWRGKSQLCVGFLAGWIRNYLSSHGNDCVFSGSLPICTATASGNFTLAFFHVLDLSLPNSTSQFLPPTLISHVCSFFNRSVHSRNIKRSNGTGKTTSFSTGRTIRKWNLPKTWVVRPPEL